jgi:hypothetical protein
MRNSFIFLVLLHNIAFSFLMILSVISPIVPLTYWIAGWVIIFEKRRLDERKLAQRSSLSATA